MSDSGAGPTSGSGGDAAEEIARLQAERDALEAELEKVKAPPKRRARRGIVGLLVALSCLLIVLSTTVVWAHRTLLNTDTFVGTVSPVFQHPEVDSAVAARATDQLFTELKLQSRLRNALPSKVGFAAAPITNATQSYVTEKVAAALGSERFQKLWTLTLSQTHEQLVAVLRGQKSATISTSGGYIVLNTVPLINNALKDVSGLASNLTGRTVTLPTITSAELPQQAVDKLSKALGVTLPSNFGQITLVRSTNLNAAQRGVKAFDRLAIALPFITVALIALTLWLSVGRRRTLVQLLVGTLLLMIVVRRVVIHEQGALANSAHNPQVAQLVLGDLLHGFFVLTLWILWVAFGVLAVALLTGPYRWAMAFRSFVARTWHIVAGTMSAERRAQTVAWMSAHAGPLQLGGAVVGGVLLLIVSVSWLSFLILGGLLAVYEVFLHTIKPPPSDDSSPTPGPESGAGVPSGSGRH
ncbi:MAG TPA: hypothetical protein VMQ59_05930 [Acidimicrobiales bacterium]|jgi:hypothetical protein|nr:hypothetical protein [Acidimicrobiales bacterium]